MSMVSQHTQRGCGVGLVDWPLYFCVCSLQPEATYSRDDVLCRAMERWFRRLPSGCVLAGYCHGFWSQMENMRAVMKAKRVRKWHVSVGNV